MNRYFNQHRNKINFDLSPLVVEHFGEAEIQNLDLPFGSDLHVGRLQVAMRDALPMRSLESLRNPPEEGQRVLNGNPPTRMTLGERLARNQLTGLAIESGWPLPIGCQGLQKRFDGDLPAEGRVTRAIRPRPVLFLS